MQRFLPYHHGVPGARWLTLLMNRIDPALFSAAFTAWVRETWPDQGGLIAIDGKTSRRSHDRGADKAPLHLVAAFATTSRLVLGQQAVADKTNETTAIPVLLAAHRKRRSQRSSGLDRRHRAKARNRCAIARCAGGLPARAVTKGEIVDSGGGALS